MVSVAKISLERANFSTRLKKALESVHHLRPSPTALSRAFNLHFSGKPITVHAARKWLIGEAIPTQDKLRSLALWLGVSVDWLRFGEPVGHLISTAATDKTALDTSPQETLVRLYMTLPQRERQLANDFINMLQQKNRSQTDVSLFPLEPINQY